MVIVDRMRFIVYFHGNETTKKLESMPVNVVYRSKRFNYVIFYGDRQNEKNYFNQIKNVKGFKKLESSLSYDEETNYTFEKN